MTLEKLDNLVKVKLLKVESPDQHEFEGLLNSAKRRLKDSQVDGLSEEGKFFLAYGAAHALAVAALRWHGYRSDNRYLVFQCLQHTVGLDNTKWRVLDKCHKQRNLAEYEVSLEITPQLLLELIQITKELLTLVTALGPVK
ncbi:MAG: hypothetical protein L0Z73_03225 [Gammaproteobacteria bacterium]|nr:hypothetical protein [Gammaproteobacteria bacterium]